MKKSARYQRLLQKDSLITAFILLSAFLYIPSTSSQDKLEKVQPSIESSEIKIPLDLYNILHIKELEIQNLELQIRLALKVPNEFNRVGDSFKPSPTPSNEKKKDEKTPSKPNP